MDSVLFMCEYLKQCGNEAGRGREVKGSGIQHSCRVKHLHEEETLDVRQNCYFSISVALNYHCH